MADGAEEVAADGGRVHKQLGVAAHSSLWCCPVGLCCPGCGAAGLPEAAYATVEPERLLGGPAIDRTARDWGPGCTVRHAAFGASRCACVWPRTKDTTVDGHVKRHVVSKKGGGAGARRATAAARRRTTGAFFVEARASSVE